MYPGTAPEIKSLGVPECSKLHHQALQTVANSPSVR